MMQKPRIYSATSKVEPQSRRVFQRLAVTPVKYLRLFKYVLRQWPHILFIVILGIAASSVTVLQPWPLKVLVDYALGDVTAPRWIVDLLAQVGFEPTPTTFIWLTAASMLCLLVVSNALSFGLAWGWASASQRMVYDLASDLFAKLQRQSLADHSQRPVGDSLNRLTADTWCVYTFAHGWVVAPLQQLVTLGAIGGLAWTLDSKLTVLSLAAVPLATIFVFFFARWLKNLSTSQRKALSRLMSLVQQTLIAIPLVQAFGTAARNHTLYQKIADQLVGLTRRRALIDQAVAMVNGIATAGVMSIVLLAGGLKVLSGGISLGDLLIFLAYVKSIHEVVLILLKTYVKIKTTEASVDRVLEVFDKTEGILDLPNCHPYRAPSEGRRGAISFQDVTYGYQAGRPVLNAINLEVKPGESLAIVGRSGSGKSTLVSLLPRFFDPWSGQVCLDGQDLRSLTLSSLRAQVSIVLQEPFLLPLSVAENIAYGRPDATHEDIVAAAERANAHEFVHRLPHGYDTVCGERGTTLSGGQRQRLAIARALLKDAPIIILDEPTSALDMESQELILEAFAKLMEDRTTLIIAHRLSTIRNADRVVVVENGRIIEANRHLELICRGGRYHHLHSLQSLRTTEHKRL
jgi:ATP-binding cassette subfamily B protein/subfamily B ATP-binding cassette protein MsbA